MPVLGNNAVESVGKVGFVGLQYSMLDGQAVGGGDGAAAAWSHQLRDPQLESRGIDAKRGHDGRLGKVTECWIYKQEVRSQIDDMIDAID